MSLLALSLGRVAVAHAQGTPSAPSADAAQQLSQDLIKTMQMVRPLNAPPPVGQVVLTTRIDGAAAMVPVTAAIGLVDVRLHNEQLKSLYPKTQTYYPTDSIVGAKRERAAAWMSRFNAVPAAEQGYALKGWQRVQLAEIASAADNDSVSRRLFDTRLAELKMSPTERSYVLYEIIATIAGIEDSARLVRNLPLAEKYLKTLQAIPLTGYKTKHDSVAVLYNQWRAEDTLIVGYTNAGDSTNVLQHARHVFPYTVVLGVRERSYPVGLMYSRVVNALRDTPVGRTQIAAFNPTVLAAARRAATEVPATTTAEDRQRLQSLEPDLKRRMDELAAWFALLGTPGSPLTAHLWLNMKDSLYSHEPTTHVVTDGKVHMLVYGYFGDNDRLATLNRTQEKFPTGFQATYLMTTGGTNGPDIVGPKDEAEWLTRFLRGVKHYTVPISIWAADKEQVGYVPEGHYPVFRPKDTPNEKPYMANMLGMTCILIDKRGVIRFYQDIETRKDETKLWKRIQLLLDEPAGAPAATTPAAPAPAGTPAAAPAAAPSASTAAPGVAPATSPAFAMTFMGDDHASH